MVRSRVLAGLLVAGIALVGCSSGSGQSKDSSKDSNVDQQFQSMVDGATGTTVDMNGVNISCLSTQINERARKGEFTLGDVQLWTSGLASDGPVQKAADEIVASGMCKSQ